MTAYQTEMTLMEADLCGSHFNVFPLGSFPSVLAVPPGCPWLSLAVPGFPLSWLSSYRVVHFGEQLDEAGPKPGVGSRGATRGRRFRGKRTVAPEISSALHASRSLGRTCNRGYCHRAPISD